MKYRPLTGPPPGAPPSTPLRALDYPFAAGRPCDVDEVRRRESMFPIVVVFWTLIVALVVETVPERPRVASAIDDSGQLNRIVLEDSDRSLNILECSHVLCEEKESFMAYFVCCDEEFNQKFEHKFTIRPEDRCCRRIKFWFFPVTIATLGFTLGAVFAMCFQCR
ncbi:hypothetical protein QR680_012300 [Steinernema hermaphroditum]|uniref:Uncharacterized protein n=1 Tax=Steinernema hermaphroditum TaxID=289476 RepID=A0AA39I437_9BILA|nr:hypothetical protein QR680_012300 [Steinernema hermaphroditum]